LDLRTLIDIVPSVNKITYNDPVMFIGSCFASSIGSLMTAGRMPVMINPAGTVYNPVSVHNTIESVISGKKYDRHDLHFHNGLYLSFSHYTDFSSTDPDEIINKINSRSREANDFLKRARYLFITFGTARVYRWRETGLVVSNCHKVPSGKFSPELLQVNEIVNLWDSLLNRLKEKYPVLKIIFTISPVRHWKDGAHGNQVSKSVLFLAVEELLYHPSAPAYFPAYELMMDDLRDYRFYGDDMLHPSQAAINYIWEAFSGAYFDKITLNTWNEVSKITRACGHRINNPSSPETTGFAIQMLKKISGIRNRVPSIDLSEAMNYFQRLKDNLP
jgi:hypothetical protein